MERDAYQRHEMQILIELALDMEACGYSELAEAVWERAIFLQRNRSVRRSEETLTRKA